MSFSSNLLMAILNTISPAIGLIGSIVKFSISENSYPKSIFLLDIGVSLLPGGFIKDLAGGMLIDSIKISGVSEAVDKIISHNDITLKCHTCGDYTNYYILENDRIICSNCLNYKITNKVEHNSKLYLFENELSSLQVEIKKVNTLYVEKVKSNNISVDKKEINYIKIGKLKINNLPIEKL